MLSQEKKAQMQRLLTKYVQGNTTPEETIFVEKYYDYFESADFDYENFSDEEKQDIEARLLQKINSRIIQTAQTRVVPMWTRVLRMGSAAAILLLLAGATYWLTIPKHPTPGLVVRPVLKNDVAAGINGAILSFANGKTIVIDTAANGQLTPSVSKTDGSISVQGGIVEYATLSTPRARQQQLVLADGSRVWLNAGSSITFPTAFTGNNREVAITGEAYFEVSKDAAKPFIVKVNDAAIEVLGTHFNVMAYANEKSLQTTLLEGSVKFRKGNHSLLLEPGQQSQLLEDGQIKLVTDADIELATAWKNGITAFHSADVATIMRVVERWYDVQVEIKGDMPRRSFYAEVSRTATLAELLKVFELNKIHFTIDGINKKLTVTP